MSFRLSFFILVPVALLFSAPVQAIQFGVSASASREITLLRHFVLQELVELSNGGQFVSSTVVSNPNAVSIDLGEFDITATADTETLLVSGFSVDYSAPAQPVAGSLLTSRVSDPSRLVENAPASCAGPFPPADCDMYPVISDYLPSADVTVEVAVSSVSFLDFSHLAAPRVINSDGAFSAVQLGQLEIDADVSLYRDGQLVDTRPIDRTAFLSVAGNCGGSASSPFCQTMTYLNTADIAQYSGESFGLGPDAFGFLVARGSEFPSGYGFRWGIEHYAVVPEPSAAVLIGLGLAGLASRRR